MPSHKKNEAPRLGFVTLAIDVLKSTCERGVYYYSISKY